MRTVVIGTLILGLVFFFLQQKASHLPGLSVEASHGFVRSTAEGAAQATSRLTRKVRDVASSSKVRAVASAWSRTAGDALSSTAAKMPQMTDEQLQRFNRVVEKLERIWEKRRAQIYDKMDLSRDQLLALDEARRDHQRDFERMFRDFSVAGEGPEVDAEIAAWGKQIDQLHGEYDTYVRTVVGRKKFETLKRELDTFNKRIEDRSPHKVIFISAW